MFTIDPSITNLQSREKSLYKVLFSMNNHQVATPEMSLEDAKSYIFFFREGGSSLSAYIGLYFIGSDRRLYFNNSTNPFPETDVSTVESEARGFIEGLGGMLDEIDFGKMSPEERIDWIRENDLFSVQKKKEEPAAAPSISETNPVMDLVSAENDEVGLRRPAELDHCVSVIQPVSHGQERDPLPRAEPEAKHLAEPLVPPTSEVRLIIVPPRKEEPPDPGQKENRAGPPDRSGKQGRQARPSAAPKSVDSPAVYLPDHTLPKREEILEEAVKSENVRPPKAQVKDDINNASAVMSRDKEALARLFASF